MSSSCDTDICSRVNKVTLQTLTPVFGPVVTRFAGGDCPDAPKGSLYDIVVALQTHVSAVLTENSHVRLRGLMVMPFCVLFKAVQCVSGNHHAASLLRAICVKLKEMLDDGSSTTTTNSLHNVAVFVAELYTIGFVDSVFMGSLCLELAGRAEQEKVCDVLLTLLQHSGDRLRKEDADVLHTVLSNVEERIGAHEQDGEDGPAPTSGRHSVLLQFLRELRFFHKKKKAKGVRGVATADDAAQAKAALQSLCGAAGGSQQETVLSVSWDQTLTGGTARWYLPAIPDYQLRDIDNNKNNNDDDEEEGGGGETRSLFARGGAMLRKDDAPHINTPFRRNVWDALTHTPALPTERLLRRLHELNPKRQHDYDLVVVLLLAIQHDAVAASVSSSPDSPILSATFKLCDNNREFVHHMQVQILRHWDELKKQKELGDLAKHVAVARWSAILIYIQRKTQKRSVLISKFPSTKTISPSSVRGVHFTLLFVALFTMCGSSMQDVLDCVFNAAPNHVLAEFLNTLAVSGSYRMLLPVVAQTTSSPADLERIGNQLKLKFEKAAQLVGQA
eukprot:PhM_4_TR5449/c0_g1_i1/m.77749/K17583/NOM1; nucleolar MIF4G domain-containing protein 1